MTGTRVRPTATIPCALLQRLVRYYRMSSNYERIELERTELGLRLRISAPDDGHPSFEGAFFALSRGNYEDVPYQLQRRT